ncbi:hypothetical protein FAVG1_06795 [Fusarium avenaceum]|nr:hypothetical protein FAVG1_06795 [Fusarium avenaceum]
MSAPGFGFSAGDFISAVKLIIDITNALKDTGGAAENYRQVLTELNLLKDILSELQKGQHGPVAEQSNNPFVKHAKTQAKLTLATLANFLALISKFDASLGHQRSTSWYRGIGRKGQWALVYAKQVDDLRLRIGTQLQALLLLSQLQESQPTKIHKQLCEIKDQNKELIGRLPERPISTIDDLRSQMELVKIQNDAVLRACLSQGPGLHRADASRLVMQGPYPHGSEEAGPSNQFVSQNTQSQIVEDQSSSPSPLAAVPLSSRDSDAMKNRDATSYQGITSSLTHLNTQSDVDTVSTLLMKLFVEKDHSERDLFTRVCFAFPQLMRQYHRLCSNISITPMLLVAENINFEDVLGRKATLHYEFFRHWPNLNRFLLRQFEDCPGEDYVARGQYFFLDSHTTNEKAEISSTLAESYHTWG